ncbi:MAG: hypothetical protein JKX73_07470 [Flavobacteriales bacterium]|nr:hypothetical protein [Flavobacteriales bacterium]
MKTIQNIISATGIVLMVVLVSSCKNDKPADPEIVPPPPVTSGCTLETIGSSSNVEGYNILSKLPGIWNGPVTSSTLLGSYAEWIVDFRPISLSQISAKNELDSVNDIFMSFFIIKHDCAYKMAFRNGGGFAGNVRTSYMIIDSVSETPSLSFYRFIDPVAGSNRVYTDVTFKNDSLIMHVYTNIYSSLPEPVSHMLWTASLRDSGSSQDAITNFFWPQKTLIKDFTSTFEGLTEAVFYNGSGDPYTEAEQPYLGNTDVSISITNPASPDPTKKVLIIITTQPLFSGLLFQPANLKYRSRYVFIDAESSTGYNFNYMHPGSYYINAIYDSNGDYNFSSGDYMNSLLDVPFTLSSSGSATANVTINFLIP